jgi:hypothetical protein
MLEKLAMPCSDARHLRSNCSRMAAELFNIVDHCSRPSLSLSKKVALLDVNGRECAVCQVLAKCVL